MRRVLRWVWIAVLVAVLVRALLARPRAARNLRMLRLGSRMGTAVASNRARRVFASPRRRADLDGELASRTAQDMATSMGEMKGLVMKLGQLLSFVDDGLPEQLRAALAQLQQDAPPMSPGTAARVVEEELGAPPGQVFARWEPQPLAAASIGQVHRATTRDGRAVVVKVQYPDIASAVRADLANCDLSRLVSPFFWPNFDVDAMLEELQSRLLEEIDYRIEAANQHRFARTYAGHPFIRVPDVVAELSTPRVLTTELGSGVRFSDIERWDQGERDLAAETIFRFVFGSLYRFRMFNGDPHPGNYLFEPGGRVTFLDFGLVRHFDPGDVETLFGPVAARLRGDDPASTRRADEQAGWLVPGAPLSDELACAYTDLFWAPWVRDEPFRFSPEYSSDFVRSILFDRESFGEVFRWSQVPPKFLMLQRINLGLIAILGRLSAGANWRRIAEETWPGIGGAPSTALGHQERDSAWSP